MKKIFVRSPYFIEVNETNQLNAKIEVYLWNKGTSEPTTPNYTFTKNIPSDNQRKLSWNVANLAKEFIKPIAPVTVLVPTEEDVKCWCYMRVVSYSDDVEVNDETFVCLNGFTSYSNGYNQFDDSSYFSLSNYYIKYYKHSLIPYVNFILEADTYNFLNYGTLIVTQTSLYKIPLTNIKNGIAVDFEFISETICEPKYTPITCTFINRFGGWQFLTFFKASMESIETDYKEFNMLPSDINYNVLQGQKRRFNHQGKKTIKCNTGWVDENYFELIEDLLLSEVVLLDNKPAVVKSKSSEKKTHLKDKNINYEIEFEYNYGIINDVI